MDQPKEVSNAISNKPNKLLVSKLDKILNASQDEHARRKAALVALSNVADISVTDLQRNLRDTMQKKEIDSTRKLLCTFGDVIEVNSTKSVKQLNQEQQLDKLHLDVMAMDGSCKTMRSHLDKAEIQAARMVKLVETYQSESTAHATHLVLAERFLEAFMINDDQVAALTAPGKSIDNTFFTSLEHLRRVLDDCKYLLASEHQKAGLDIMEKLSQYQDIAYNKLLRWMQRESQSVFNGEIIDANQVTVKALEALMYRPVSLQLVLDDMGTARRNTVTHAFNIALTRGGPGGTPRPIELQAHDPLRYIGDMLAWVHQSCASEKEMLENLFYSIRSKILKTDSGHISDKEEDTPSLANVQLDDIINDLLDRTMEGTCRPLKTRMEPVLSQQQDAMKAYQAANLIQYYTFTIGKLFRGETTLQKSLSEIIETAYKYFFRMLNAQAQQSLQSVETPLEGLQVTLAVRGQTKQLEEILESYENSLIAELATLDDTRQFDIGDALDAIIDPLLQMCDLSSQKLDRISHDIYLLNCMRHIQSVLIPHERAHRKSELIGTQIKDLLAGLATSQYEDFLAKSGFSVIVDALDKQPSGVPLAQTMSTQEMIQALSALEAFLNHADSSAFPQLMHLFTLEDRQKILSDAFSRLLETYQSIYDVISDPKNEYDDPEAILPLSVQNMETIVGIFILHDQDRHDQQTV